MLGSEQQYPFILEVASGKMFTEAGGTSMKMTTTWYGVKLHPKNETEKMVLAELYAVIELPPPENRHSVGSKELGDDGGLILYL